MRHPMGSGRVSRPLFVSVAVAVGVAIALLLQALVVQVARVPSGSMQPTLHPGDRVLIDRLSGLWRPLRRGDVVVFDPSDAWGTPPQLVVKRILGLPGDRVRCCDASGHLVRNGRTLLEAYAVGTSRARRFDVVVPPDRLWLMGDDRARSVDSSAHLDAPGGGSVPVNDVSGRVVAVVWPLNRAGILGTP